MLIKNIPIEHLQVGQYQPRTIFAEDELNNLAQSIKTTGMIQPIVIRSIGEGQYEILAGERRWRAAQLARLHEVPCIIQDCSDEQAALIATVENVNRVNLNPIEEAKAYDRLIHEFNYTHEQMAELVGKSRTKVTNLLRLLNCDGRVQTLIHDAKLHEACGKILASLPLNTQYPIAIKAIQQQWNVKQLAQYIKRKEKNRGEVSISKKDANILTLERQISEALGCDVHIDFSGISGKLTVDFDNLEVLDGILDKLQIFEGIT